MTATVLLVEDEDDTRELLGRALTRAGYTALVAASVAEALERFLAAARVDVVVTDVVLGGDDRGGLRLLSELRARGAVVKVVVMTAFADVDKVKTALNEGASHFLEKPFRAAELVAAVERVLVRPEDAIRPREEILTRARLTEKELVVARLLLTGKSSSEIAVIEQNSPKTIRQHVSQIYAKCGVATRAEFFRLAYGIDEGLGR